MLQTSFNSNKNNLMPGQTGRQYKLTMRLSWQAIVFSIAGVGLTTAIFVVLNVAPYNVNMAYTLLTLVATVWFGLGAGVLVALIAFLCFNYFFIPPHFTFFIEAEQGWFAIFLFLGTALFANQVAGWARLNNQQAQQHSREATALYELATAVLTKIDQREMLLAVLQKVSSALSTLSCTLYLTDEQKGGLLTESARIDMSELTDQHVTRHPDLGLALNAFNQNRPSFLRGEAENQHKPSAVVHPVAYLPLTVGERVLGVMVVVGQARNTEFKPEEQRLTLGFANHVALAVEHARLIREAAQVATLRDADRLKSALLASVSHELRTPLTSIKTAVANLQSKDIKWQPDEEEEFLDTIESETERLARLVSNLLDLSKLESHNLQPDFGWYYLPEIVEEVVERLKSSPLVRSHPITVNCVSDIPLTRMDYLQIDQVLTNLLENAAKYSAALTPIRLQVEIKLWREIPAKQRQIAANDQLLLVSVMDEGRGIPEDELERIFDKFYRVRNSPNGMRDVAGSGIGLAITRGIIEAHGGKIWAKNRMYGGAIFNFTLPLVPLDAQFREQQAENE